MAVISYRLWQTHFAANPNIVGQTIELDEHLYSIVGSDAGGVSGQPDRRANGPLGSDLTDASAV